MQNLADATKLQRIKFYAWIDACFQNALKKGATIQKDYRIARFVVRLQFANDALVSKLTHALAHLEIPTSLKPDLTIGLWDSASTGTETIAPAWPNPVYTDRGELWHYNDEQYYSVFDRHTGSLNLYDNRAARAYYWTQDAAQLPWWVAGSPLQLLLHAFTSQHGLQLTHAAAVGYEHGGVLLTGKGGSGKSTTALACLKAGMQYVSEDYCLLAHTPAPTVFSVYNSAKLEDNTLKFFPELQQHLVNQDRKPGEKGLLFQNDFQAQHLINEFPLRALCVLKVAHQPKTELINISPQEALSALAVSTMWQLVGSKADTYSFLNQLAMTLPCYRLQLGHDIANIPNIIKELL